MMLIRFSRIAAQLHHALNADQGDDEEPEEFAERMDTGHAKTVDRVIEEKVEQTNAATANRAPSMTP